MQLFGTVPLGRNAKYGYIDYDATEWTPAVQQHVWDYGIRQILNDAIADKTDDDGYALPIGHLRAKATKRLDTLKSGELRTRREGVEPVDPVEKHMWNAAKAAITEAAKKSPIYGTIKPAKGVDRVVAVLKARAANPDEMDMAAAIGQYLERNGDRLRAQAETAVAEANAAAAAALDYLFDEPETDEPDEDPTPPASTPTLRRGRRSSQTA